MLSHVQTSLLSQDMGAKHAISSNPFEAASREGAEVAQAEFTHNPELTGSNPGEFPLPKIVCPDSQVYMGQPRRALQGIGSLGCSNVIGVISLRQEDFCHLQLSDLECMSSHTHAYRLCLLS